LLSGLPDVRLVGLDRPRRFDGPRAPVDPATIPALRGFGLGAAADLLSA